MSIALFGYRNAGKTSPETKTVSPAAMQILANGKVAGKRAYRAVRYVAGFLIQFWMLASPVAYPSSIVPQRWRWLYGLNGKREPGEAVEIGALRAYDRPQPTMRNYDQLLENYPTSGVIQ